MSTRSRAETTEVRNLSELLARVEKATKRDREVDAAIALAFGWRHVMEPYSGGDPIPCWYDHNNIEQFLPYFTSSLEAAVALVERVLPGVSYVQRHDPDQIKWDGRHYAANVGDMPHEGGNFWIAAPTPALALIAATLRALKVRAEAERIGSPSQEQTESEQNKKAPIYLTQKHPKPRFASARYNLVERAFRRGHFVRGRDQSLPRIADDFLDCAVYLYQNPEDAKSGSEIGGSGFLVGIPHADPNRNYDIVVTNLHVIERGNPVVRMNDMLDFAYPTVLCASSPDDSESGEFQPGTVWSLWDLHRIQARKLVKTLTTIDVVRRSAQSDEGSMDEPMSAADVASAKKGLTRIMTNLVPLKAKITARALRDVLKECDNKEPPTFRSISNGVEEVYNTLIRELEDVSLFVPSNQYAQLLEADDPPFGTDVFRAFPDAARDITESGKCLALVRNTASVFHLMLAMERALRVLAQKINATVLDKNGQFDKWSVIVGNIKRSAEALPKADQDKWIEAHNLLWGVNKVWRNDTMHPAEAYTDEEAAKVYEAVKTFMQHLAALV